MNSLDETLDDISNLDLASIYVEIQRFVDDLASDFPEHHKNTKQVYVYMEHRMKHENAIRQDMLPLLTYLAISQQKNYKRAIPLASTWMLYLAASHAVDAAQDEGIQSFNYAASTFGLANIGLTKLDTDYDTLCDIIDALGRMVKMGVDAQSDEFKHGNKWTRADYFRYIAGKGAAIIATGIWIGGRLAAAGDEVLVMLREFGLALGMSLQISDDCTDLAEDLMIGTYTLPVIEGLSFQDHAQCSLLKQLTNQPSLSEEQAHQIIQILQDMGAINICKRMARAYQVQAAAVFDEVPNLATFFMNYVTSN